MQTLERVAGGDLCSRIVPGIFASNGSWDERDRAFYTALVETELSHQVTIDAVIAAYSSTRLKKLDKKVLSAVRLAAAQVFYMDRVPDSAACNEAVKLVKSGRTSRYCGFTNALIRQIIREKDSPEARVVCGSVSVRLRRENGSWKVTDEKYRKYEKLLSKSLTYSYPLWIVSFFEKNYPGVPVLEGLCRKRRISALAAVSPDQINGARSYGIKDLPAVFFGDGTYPALSEEFKAGDFYIMDLSSMQPVAAAGLNEGIKVLDLCASPGGKSIEAALLGNASVLSCDVSELKVARIRENVERMHLGTRISVQVNDASKFNRDFENRFDAVIADCPCSGLGVSGRKPEIRLRLAEGDLASLTSLQEKILGNAARYVKPGGTLIYSTCTLNPGENEGQTDHFLHVHPDFTLKDEKTIYPDEDHDGFFYAIMARKDI